MIDEPKNKTTIKVRIYGKEYSIRSSRSTEYVEEVARYVDNKMTEVDKSGVSSSPVQVAVLAAMNITDELLSIKMDGSSETKEVEDRAKNLIDRISSVLEE
jgi:cell division protein ZapA